MIGLPVTALTLSAAPPRASPSSLVMTTPSNSAASAKDSATPTASWPVIASTTRRTSCGVGLLADPRELGHQVLVDVEAAGGVDDEDVAALLAGPLERPAGDLDRVGFGAPARRRRPRRAGPSSPAARPRPAGRRRRRRGRRPCPACGSTGRAWRRRSSCRSPAGPAIRITVGPERAIASSAPRRPSARRAPR